VITRFLIMRPDQPHETSEVDWPPEPGYDKLRALLTPLLDGADLEHVTVLADFCGGADYKRADMFVDETSVLKGLPENGAATAIYRRNWMMQHPEQDPETLPAIAGPAILFERRVWF
jgi:hypothetical protein